MVEKFPEWANLYGKPDMERLGLFSEMPYMNGKGYVSLFPKPAVTKGRNIMGEGPKSKNATQAGYFDKEYRRLFTGEAIKGRGRKPVDKYGEKAKYKQYGIVLNGPMRTTHHPQPYFDNNPYPNPPNIKPGPTYVKPKETGPGPLPPGIIVPIGKHKLPGAECFDTFPEYKANKYVTTYDLIKPRKNTGGIFYPQSMAQKSLNTTHMISDKMHNFKVNRTNYTTYEPKYIKYLVD
ncbi:hypothetical protein NQ317_009642 [Molorchus minor]|uniref:Cilia-and flagella-associated protein 96 n=1 Tax=Molorchus minor TaxID=1323400 RepID=A0ABQ9JYI3_9CUCU|nr:hypothetical protein NQ317_009642 [Molorchus minor]